MNNAPKRPLRLFLPRLEGAALPVFFALAVIWIVFQSLSPNFLTPLNLTNLMLQIAAGGTLSVGVVLVLLLGEIDLSIGLVGGLCAAVMAVLNVKHGVPGPWAVLIGLAVGLAIGLLQGTWIARARVPSFIVTLAGQMVWQGALLWVLGETGTVNLRDPFVLGIAGTFFSPLIGWLVGLALCLLLVGSRLYHRRKRLAAGLPVDPVGFFTVKLVLAAALLAAGIGVLNADRGLPSAVVIFLGVVMTVEFVLRRTRFGRHVFAVGGNPESARRTGIRVVAVKVAVFTLASGLAALGGILGASRLLAVNQSSGGGEILLNAIAAAVVGGTSLFGGRGTAWSALTGFLVIGSIANGMDLLALSSAMRFMITGGVLLLAVTADALLRRRRAEAAR